jgi:hypothetical protein
MPKRIYQKKRPTTIKVRLQHTEPGDELSPLLEDLAEGIDKTQLVAFSKPRLGTNPKYAGNQATAMYLEIDVEVLRKMFQFLKLSAQSTIAA